MVLTTKCFPLSSFDQFFRLYFKNNCGHVFVDGSKVIVETDTFKRTTEFYSIFNSSIQMEFNDSIVELEIYSNVNKLADALLKEYGVD